MDAKHLPTLSRILIQPQLCFRSSSWFEMGHESSKLPHFIVANGRSGSNHIVNALNSHPNVVNFGEVLGDWTLAYRTLGRFYERFSTVDRYLGLFYRSSIAFSVGQLSTALAHRQRGALTSFKDRRNITTIGLKELWVPIQTWDAQHALLNWPDLKLIHIRRDNVLRRLVSSVKLKETGRSAAYAGESEAKSRDGSLYLPTRALLEKLSVFERENHQLSEFVAQFPVDRTFSIEYEDYASAPQRQELILADLLRFLDVAVLPLRSDHVKSSQFDLRKALQNFDQVAAKLEGTRFERFLAL